MESKADFSREVKKKPTVSVIIPTYNRAALLSRAIRSVLNQTYQDFEIIVVNDGSSDNTNEVIKELKNKKIKYIVHEHNKGGGAARNTGIKASKGEYIALLDSDDEWFPEKLEKQMKLFSENNPKLGVVYTGFDYIDGTNGNMIMRRIPEKRGYIYYDLLLNNCIGGCSFSIIKKQCLEEIGLFDETLPCFQDRDIWIKIAKKYKFDYIPEPLGIYYRYPESLYHNPHNRIRGRLIINKKILREIELNERKLNFSKREKSKKYFQIGYAFLSLRNLKEARKEIFKAIKIYPFNFRYFFYFFLSFLNKDLYEFLAKVKKYL